MMRIIAIFLAAFVLLPSVAEAHHRHHHGHHQCLIAGKKQDAGNSLKSNAAMVHTRCSTLTSAAKNTGLSASAEIDRLLSIPGTKAVGIPLPRPRSAYLSLEEALVRYAIWEFREVKEMKREAER